MGKIACECGSWWGSFTLCHGGIAIFIKEIDIAIQLIGKIHTRGEVCCPVSCRIHWYLQVTPIIVSPCIGRYCCCRAIIWCGTGHHFSGGIIFSYFKRNQFQGIRKIYPTFHYGFDRPIAQGELLLTLATFHFWYSQGHAFLYGSTDGSSWQQLVEVEPPAEGLGRGGGWNGPLPTTFIGATDIWLQVRLYSWGPEAPRGGVYCNTAQMFRYDPRQTSNTFELMVDLQD